MVCIVPGVSDDKILEQMEVYYKDVVYQGPHLLAMTENTPRSDTPGPQDMSGEEIYPHILQPLSCHRHRYCLVALVPVLYQHISVEVSVNKELCSLGSMANR